MHRQTSADQRDTESAAGRLSEPPGERAGKGQTGDNTEGTRFVETEWWPDL